MENNPIPRHFVSPEDAMAGGGSIEKNDTPRAGQNKLVDIAEGASRDEVIDAYVARQAELAQATQEIEARPGFKLDATELIGKHAEQAKAEKEFDTLSEEWSRLGGDELIEAQKAIDALNFKSTASDRLAAQNRLRDAKDAFYASYSAQLNTQGDSVSAKTAEDAFDTFQIPEAPPAPDSLNLEGQVPQETSNTSEMSVGDQIIVRRTSGELQNDWRVSGLFPGTDGKPLVEVRRNTLENDGLVAVKTYPLDELQALQNEAKNTDTNEVPAADSIQRQSPASQEKVAPASTPETDFEDARMQVRRMGGAALDAVADAGANVLVNWREYMRNRQEKKWRKGNKKENGVLRKTFKKQNKEFSKSVRHDSAMQAAADKVELATAKRQDKLERNLFDKRLAAELKLEAKQDAKMESFREREKKRAVRRLKLGRLAAKARVKLGF